MKQLMIMRHAKSSWADGSLSDHDRPLNRRGVDNAPRMGHFVSEQECLPDLILSSTAKRAITTAELFVEGCGQTIPIVQRRALYHACIEDYCESIMSLAEDQKRLMVISHNPGSEEWVYQLTQQYERMPTAAIAIVAFNDKFAWPDICQGNDAELLEVWRPREVL